MTEHRKEITLLFVFLAVVVGFAVYMLWPQIRDVIDPRIKPFYSRMRPLTEAEWKACMEDPENKRVTKEWEDKIRTTMPHASPQAEGPMIDCNRFRGKGK